MVVGTSDFYPSKPRRIKFLDHLTNHSLWKGKTETTKTCLKRTLSSEEEHYNFKAGLFTIHITEAFLLNIKAYLHTLEEYFCPTNVSGEK